MEQIHVFRSVQSENEWNKNHSFCEESIFNGHIGLLLSCSGSNLCTHHHMTDFQSFKYLFVFVFMLLFFATMSCDHESISSYFDKIKCLNLSRIIAPFFCLDSFPKNSYEMVPKFGQKGKTHVNWNTTKSEKHWQFYYCLCYHHHLQTFPPIILHYLPEMLF